MRTTGESRFAQRTLHSFRQVGQPSWVLHDHFVAVRLDHAHFGEPAKGARERFACQVEVAGEVTLEAGEADDAGLFIRQCAFRIRATDSADGYCVGQSDVFTIPQ